MIEIREVRYKYSSQEDEVIIACIQESPQNLQMAFGLASTKLVGRKLEAISQRYYGTLKKRNLVAIGSAKTIVVGVKNAIRKESSMQDVMLRAAFTKMSKEQLIDAILPMLGNQVKVNMIMSVVQKM